MPLPFRLATDGDDLERHCWPLFVRREFRSYERVWYVFVVPLTNRDTNRSDVHFKTDAELAALAPPRGFYHLYLAQLNYSVLWHLSAVYAMRAAGAAAGWDTQLFVGAILRLCSAHDVADELLHRDAEGKLSSDPWGRAAQRARSAWRNKNPSPTFLRDLQDYRHQLVHGGPFMHWAEGPYFPKVGLHRDYRDWRKATSPLTESELAHFDHASEIVERAWDHTLRYLEASWRQMLRRHGMARTPLPRMRRFDSIARVAGPAVAGTLSTTTPTVSFGYADAMDVRLIDALIASRPRTATTEPVIRMPAAEFWSVPVGVESGSSTASSAPILSGSFPEEAIRSVSIDAPRRPARRRRSKSGR